MVLCNHVWRFKYNVDVFIACSTLWTCFPNISGYTSSLNRGSCSRDQCQWRKVVDTLIKYLSTILPEVIIPSILIELVRSFGFVVRSVFTCLVLSVLNYMKWKWTANSRVIGVRMHGLLFKDVGCNVLARISQWSSSAKRKAKVRSPQEIHLTRWWEGVQKQNIMSEGERIRDEGLPVYKRIMIKKRKYGEWNKNRMRRREGEKWE